MPPKFSAPNPRRDASHPPLSEVTLKATERTCACPAKAGSASGIGVHEDAVADPRHHDTPVSG